MNLRIAGPLICLTIFAFGCGKSPYALVPVSGTVLLDGKPLPDAQVAFLPITKPGVLKAGDGSRGKTDAQGHFELTCVNGEPGASWGDHIVQISTGVYEAQGDDKPAKVIKPELVPKRYHSGGNQKFTVPDTGTNTANFDLKSKD